MENSFERDFAIKRNDTFPCLVARLRTKSCLDSIVPLNLSAVTAVTFSMSDSCGNLAISSKPAEIVSETEGTIQYAWAEGDTSEAGYFNGEFEMFFIGGGKLSVPIIGGVKIQIIEDVNNF